MKLCDDRASSSADEGDDIGGGCGCWLKKTAHLTLAASSGKRSASDWCPSARLSVRYFYTSTVHPVGHRRRYVFDLFVRLCACVRACLAKTFSDRFAIDF